MNVLDAIDFFKTGGALDPDDPSYVIRQADQALGRAVLSGQYCNILTSRQMGKSSLMVRTVSYLQSQNTRTVVIDLTNIGTTVSASEWYFGIISQFKRQLDLTLDEAAWWTERTGLGPVQRFSDFLRQVVLGEVKESIVVFIDEIDSTLNLRFTDDFFAAIRAAYNARARDPVYHRLTFVLVGVARPADLIKNRWRTPYNIGTSIDLGDFTESEAQTLLNGLKVAYPQHAENILERVLYWTDGHPYLSQKMCAEVVAEDNDLMDEGMDTLVERLFLTTKAKREESNLMFIRDRIRETRERGAMLRVYRRVWASEQIKDEERSVTKSQLKLIGLVKVGSGGYLVVRNRIYSQIFDAQWVKENMPVSLARRIAIVTTTVAILLVLIVGYLVYLDRSRPDNVKAELYTTGFQNTTSPEVRLNNLAGLFRLKGYQDQARELFFELTRGEQLAMFVGLDNPQQVEADILTVVEGVYQDQRLENNPAQNQL
ncbi:MAG: AAA-like domain-containing protein, partial [Anaerolineae bacterium]|nr:AAA-like domain-containing protein [Anaerolineae bacterium]